MKVPRNATFLKIMLPFFLCTWAQASSFAQQKTMHAAFIGTRWEPSAVSGGGMSSTEVIIYFRPDGTYSHTLGKNWQTDFDGRYSIIAENIVLTDNKGQKEAIPYKGDGSFWYDRTTVYKKEPANKIPPGYYSFSTSSGSGGIGSGTDAPYVGSRSHKGFQFNADGTFSSGTSSSTYISGETVSGHGKRKKDEDGTYTIKDGLLTLYFNNGEKSINSCFTSDAVSSIVLNGTTYYAEEKNKDDTKPRPSTSATNVPASDLGSGQAYLKIANQSNGGKYLDAIRTAKLEYSMGNGVIQITTLLDLSQSTIRIEYRKNGQLMGIEQSDATTGWEYTNGKTTALPRQRISEMQDAFFHGMFNLQTGRLGKIKLLSAPKTANAETSLVVEADDGTVMAWVFDKDNLLTGKASKINGKPVTHFFSAFRRVNNIVLPFHVKEVRDNKTFTYVFSGFEINPTLNNESWSKP